MTKERQMMLAKAVANTLKQQTLRKQIVGNIEYQIYPCVMLVEGVHHGIGSDPVYYNQAVLERSAAAWNNMPVTVGHPVLSDGTHVLCNHDGTIRQQFQIGHIANVRFEDGKLKADIWINTSRASSISPALLQFIENGGNLEVSTGMMALDDGTAGIWNNEEFSASIIDMMPDHLALLPNSTGACSWIDGCGVRFNTAVKNKESHIILINSLDLMALQERIRIYIDSMDVYDRNTDQSIIINFTRAIYSDHFIYKQRVRRPNQPEIEVLLKQEYAVDDNGELSFPTPAAEVVEEITYKPKANEGAVQLANTNTLKEGTMAETKGKKCCEAKINALIANDKNAFAETDREWLTSLNDAQIEKLISNDEVATEPVKTEAPVAAPAAPVDLTGFLNSAPPEIRAVLNSGLRELDNKRANLITRIIANEQNTFKEDALKGMDVSMLESIAALIPVKPTSRPNFSGRSPGETIVNEGEGPGEEAYVPRTLEDIFATKQ